MSVLLCPVGLVRNTFLRFEPNVWSCYFIDRSSFHELGYILLYFCASILLNIYMSWNLINWKTARQASCYLILVGQAWLKLYNFWKLIWYRGRVDILFNMIIILILVLFSLVHSTSILFNIIIFLFLVACIFIGILVGLYH